MGFIQNFIDNFLGFSAGPILIQSDKDEKVCKNCGAQMPEQENQMIIDGSWTCEKCGALNDASDDASEGEG